MKTHVGRNVKWVSIAQAARIVLQLLSIAILARLLNKQDYGLMAMAAVVTTLATFIRDLGTASAIIQTQNLSDETKSAVFWLNMITGGAIGLALMVSSPILASLFNEPDLASILIWLAVAFPITSSTAVHQALLERQSKFDVIARVEIISQSLGLAGGVIGAYFGLGVYSLVLQSLLTAALSSAQLWTLAKWRPSGNFEYKNLKAILGYSGNLTGFTLVNYFSRNADGFIIGRQLGAAQLGIYAMAYKLMLFPLQSISFVANKALFPIMSRQQQDIGEMRALYLKSVSIVCFLTAPLMSGLWFTRDPFVDVMFGPSWGEVAPILLWFAPVGFLQSVMSTAGPVFMARGKTNVLLWLGIFGAITQVSAFVIGAQFSITVVAILYLFANLVNFVPNMYITMRFLDGSLWDIAKRMAGPTFASAVMLGSLALFSYFFDEKDIGSIFRLLIYAIIGALVYISTIFIIDRSLIRIALSVVKKPH